MARYDNQTVNTIPGIAAELEKVSIEIDKLLSRSGDGPNQMLTIFDMNSNRIINLGAPQEATDVPRFQDLEALGDNNTVTINNDITNISNFSSDYLQAELNGVTSSNTGAENSLALKTLIEANPRKTIRIGAGTLDFDTMDVTVTGTALWLDDGTIINATTGGVETFWKFNTQECYIYGNGLIEGNNLFSNGVLVENLLDTSNPCIITDIRVQNFLQLEGQSQSVGIRVNGKFLPADVRGCTVDNITSIALTGRICRGVLFVGDTTNKERFSPVMRVQDCNIMNIKPFDDADGCFAQVDTSQSREAIFLVRGNYFKDCHKRAMKSQVNKTICTDNHHHRTENLAAGGSFADFDGQRGGFIACNNIITVDDASITAVTNGSFFVANTFANDSYVHASRICNNVVEFITGTGTIPRFCIVGNRGNNYNTDVIIENNNMDGDCDQFILYNLDVATANPTKDIIIQAIGNRFRSANFFLQTSKSGVVTATDVPITMYMDRNTAESATGILTDTTTKLIDAAVEGTQNKNISELTLLKKDGGFFVGYGEALSENTIAITVKHENGGTFDIEGSFALGQSGPGNGEMVVRKASILSDSQHGFVYVNNYQTLDINGNVGAWSVSTFAASQTVMTKSAGSVLGVNPGKFFVLVTGGGVTDVTIAIT